MRYNDNIVTVVSHRFNSLVVFGVTYINDVIVM